jgi:DNA-binding NarL/FixJ family response regulator
MPTTVDSNTGSARGLRDVSILIIDDHPASGQALAYVVDKVLAALGYVGGKAEGATTQVVRTVTTLNQAVPVLLGSSLFSRPSVIFLDLGLDAETDPWDALRRVRVAAPPDARLFVWSGAPVDQAALERAWKEGTSGWIPKGLAADEIEEAVHCALTMGFYMPSPRTRGATPATTGGEDLSPAERELAVLVGMDLDLQTIANTATGGSLAEASARVAALCSKLGASTLRAAAERARTLGFV